MWRSGLLLIACFAIALVVERWLVAQHQLRFGWGVALALATGVTLSVGSVQGLVQAWRARTAAPADPASWRDGETVQVEGLLRVRDGEPAMRTAPFSGRPVAYLAYRSFSPRMPDDISPTQRALWRGLVANPLALETPAGRIPLVGMPPVREWPEQQFSGPEFHEAAARHLASTAWQSTDLDDDTGPTSLLAALSGTSADAAGRLQHHVMNVEAAAALGLRDGAASTAAALQRQLAARPWTFAERLVPPDVRVTVVATYRASPRRLDVGRSPVAPQHAVHLGAAAAVADRAWTGTLWFALGLMALTVVGHVVVYGPGRGWLQTPM
jgi:hypothetical protein